MTRGLDVDVALTIVAYWFLSLCFLLCLWYVTRSVVISRAEKRRAQIAADEFYKLLREKRHHDES